MYKSIICFLAALLVVQSAFLPSAVVDDAEARLEDLRKEINVGLNYTFEMYKGLAKAVETTARDIKADKPSDTVAQCVNRVANNTIDIIYKASMTLASTFIWRVYEAEKQIVFCGPSNDACLNTAIEDMDKNIATIPDEINAIYFADYETIRQQLHALAACASLKAEVKSKITQLFN